MKQLSSTEQALVAGIDQQAMLDRVMEWAAINTGTGNLEGLAKLSDLLADCLAQLPGDVRFADPA